MRRAQVLGADAKIENTGTSINGGPVCIDARIRVLPPPMGLDASLARRS